MGINLILFYQLKELNMQKKKLEAYDEYMPMVQQLITQVRIRQHNHTNEIQSLIALTHIHKDYDSLTHAMYHYIGDMVNNSPPEYLLKSNMLLVSGFLYQKERMAEKEHKTIHYHFKTYELHSYAPEYILTELFGILIDNALEAIDKEQIVSVQIDSINERVIFSISNPGYLLSGKERTLFFEKGYSSKTNSDSGTHSGLGLYRLKNVVMEQYKGSISLYNEGTNIIFDITI
jgi:two-component system sensor histidine kinase AgrC